MAKLDSLPCTTPDTTSTKPVSLCQECKTESFRYQCPGCSLRTCSLHCCVSHKKRTGCNGKRDRTKFLPVARMNDNTVSSDYHFLEDVLGAVERAKRTASSTGKQSNTPHRNNKRFKSSTNGEDPNSMEDEGPHSMLQQMDISKQEPSSDSKSPPSLPPNCWKQLSPKWRQFWQQAQLRGIHLLLMPSGMKRRIANTSYLKKDVLYWKVDLRIHSQDPNGSVQVKSKKLGEQCNLVAELQQMVDDKQDDWCWLIQKLPSPANRPCYVDISSKNTTTLQSILKGTTIIEYPTIEAVPQCRLKDFPLAIEEVQEECLMVQQANAKEEDCEQAVTE